MVTFAIEPFGNLAGAGEKGGGASSRQVAGIRA
jgi:hypothetical protein